MQAIRLIAAYLVLIRHSFILLGEHSPLIGIPLMPIGIWVFFAISGYLLPPSWERRPHLGRYAQARIVRLVPALAAVVIASAFVLGPLLTTISRREYLVHPQTWQYLNNILLKPTYSLPGVFVDNYYPHAVNGSLWSIPPQFLTYALVPLIFLLKFRGLRITAWLGIFVLAHFDHATGQLGEIVVWGNSVSQALTAIALFAAGALLRELNIKLNLVAAFAALTVLIGVPFALPGTQYLLLTILLPYIVLTVGMRSWPILRSANKLPEISYGVFLVGFPIQQGVIAIAPQMNPWLSVFTAVALSTIAALVLERVIERPIIRRFSPKRVEANNRRQAVSAEPAERAGRGRQAGRSTQAPATAGSTASTTASSAASHTASQ